VKDYLLFIDTEASGLPKKWDLPYSAEDNWPFCVQISWIVFTKEGQKIKQDNHYIKEDDFEIEKSATKIHGIEKSFLSKNGVSRQKVMKLLHDDLCWYQPLVIGHFMQFDYHMMAVDFYRSGIQNPVKKELTFCTMLATTHLIKNPTARFFKLGELYQTLFDKVLLHQHDALVDAKATAECFFELLKRGEITDEIILKQQCEIRKPYEQNKSGCILPLISIFCLFLLIFYYL
jgi:DNA polymerase-3 subunit epsilon